MFAGCPIHALHRITARHSGPRAQYPHNYPSFWRSQNLRRCPAGAPFMRALCAWVGFPSITSQFVILGRRPSIRITARHSGPKAQYLPHRTSFWRSQNLCRCFFCHSAAKRRNLLWLFGGSRGLQAPESIPSKNRASALGLSCTHPLPSRCRRPTPLRHRQRNLQRANFIRRPVHNSDPDEELTRG